MVMLQRYLGQEMWNVIKQITEKIWLWVCGMAFLVVWESPTQLHQPTYEPGRRERIIREREYEIDGEEE